MASSSIGDLKRLLAGAPRIAVLAAHPDDETIGASMLLERFPNAQIIYLTDGAPRDKKLWPAEMSGSRGEYAALRRQEAAQALSHAGISATQLHWLGTVDQGAILSAREISQDLAELLAQLGTNLLVSHPYEGGHPDHDCAALVARVATEKLERRESAPLRCEMTSYHARDGQCVTGEFLNPDEPTEIVFELTDEACERKRRMMDEYKSQRLVLENFPILAERLRVAPEYDFARPPHEGELWYEIMGWMVGERWRELASIAGARARECSCP